MMPSEQTSRDRRRIKIETCEQWLLEKQKEITPRNSRTGKPRYGQTHWLVYRIDTDYYDGLELLPEYLQEEIYEMEGEEIHNRDGILGDRGTGEHLSIHIDDWNGNRDITIKWRKFIKRVYEKEAE